MKRVIFVIILLVCMTATIAQEAYPKVELHKGKNLLCLNMSFSPLYSSTLILMNPEIQSITLEINNKTVGYVNAFGGIGTNIVIQPNITYEITTKQNITIELR